MLDELLEALFERRKKHRRWVDDDDWEPRRRPPRRYEDDDDWPRRGAPPAREGHRYREEADDERRWRERRRDWDDDWDEDWDDWEERRRYRGSRYGPPKKKPWWKKLGDLLEFGD